MDTKTIINGKEGKVCRLKMVEIYSGRNPAWKGWHNLVLDLGGPEFDKAIAGPLDPETSLEMKIAIKAGHE